MKLVAIAAFLAVCGAAKLDRTYLPPASAVTAGGSPDSLQTPFSRSSSDQGTSDNLPTGSYTNNFQGVVVDAATAGVRASPNGDQSGLGGPRDSYGSENSKVGDAAFRGSLAGFRTKPFGSLGSNGQASGNNAGQNFASFESKSERPQSFKDRNSNIISYANDVSADNYSYGFESDNGIAVGENGVDSNGIKAQGGYSYKGDDGQVYKVTYVADEGGYRPQGDHLPTPPPIPKEILESLEQNAKDEAAGLVDDGSYDAQKYNAEGDYTHHNSGNIQYNGAQLSQFSKRPESDAATSNTLINQNNQVFGKPAQLGNIVAQNTHSQFNGQSNQFGINSANNQGVFSGSQDKHTSQQSGNKKGPSTSSHSSGSFIQNSESQLQFGQTQGALGIQSTQFGSQHNQQVSNPQLGTQPTQSGFQANQQALNNQYGGQFNQVGSSSQFGSKPSQPLFGQGSTLAFNSQLNQGNHLGQALKPQSSSNLNNFGQSSQFNNNQQETSLNTQTQSLNEGSHKPSFGNFGSKNPSGISQGQSVSNNGNRFPTGQNQFAVENLPPMSSNDKPHTNDSAVSDDSNKNDQTLDFIPLQGQNQNLGSSASAFASVSSNGLAPQSVKPLNNIQNARPNQLNFNNQGASGQSLPISSQHSGSHAVPTLTFGAKPTSVPNTELTTPLEPNEKPAFSQGSQFSSQFASSFDSQPLNDQAKPENGFQSAPDTGNQQSTNQFSSFSDSRPQSSSQYESSSPLPAISSVQQELNSNSQRPQFSQNAFSQNQQNNANQNQQNKPSFSQGPDDSYYYNQPSKPFGTPVAGPEGSRFPNTPSYQSNGVVSSQNNQFLSKPGPLTSSTKFPSSPSVTSAVPTPPSQFTQNQGSSSSNYYNGITQASISPFPSISSTASTQYGTTQTVQFGSKPIQQSGSQPNQPIISQQQTSVPSFPSKPGNTFRPSPSTSFSQNQISFGQTSLNNNNNLPSESTATTFDSTPNTAQTQIQSEENSPSNTTYSQQYEGTVYEYNKPAEVLPAPEQTDSSLSQSSQSNESAKPQESQSNTQESKPQFGSQQSQFNQNTFSSQTQQSNLNQPQQNLQAFKPFGTSNDINNQFIQNTQNTQEVQDNVQAVKPNEPSSLVTSQIVQNSQTNSASRPQFGSQPTKPLSSVNPSQIGQNIQQSQGSTSTYQTGSQIGAQPFNKPFGGAQSITNQFGQNSQTNFGNKFPQQNLESQITQSNKPFGSASTFSQFGQAAQIQNTFAQSNAQNTQGLQPNKPVGINGMAQNVQGYPSGKPQFDAQLTQTQFTHNSQQSFRPTQNNPQLVQGSQTNIAQLFGNAQPGSSSLDSQKPQFGSFQFNQGVKPSSTSFGQQNFQSSQFGSSLSKPQFGIPTQISQNIAQTSNSAVNQPQSTQEAYKPFGASSTQTSSFLSQNKPQFDQSLQSSQGVSTTTSSPLQFEAQPLKPFAISGIAGSQVNSQAAQKPVSFGSPCCQGSIGSSITSLNVGKPSQAFAQAQSQFTGFQGVQSLNSQSVAGKGEEFGGPRQPPTFDSQSGYHY